MLKKMDSGWLGMLGDAPFKTGKKEEEECLSINTCWLTSVVGVNSLVIPIF